VFLMADVSLQPIASRLVKEIALYGGPIHRFVSSRVCEEVTARVEQIGRKGSLMLILGSALRDYRAYGLQIRTWRGFLMSPNKFTRLSLAISWWPAAWLAFAVAHYAQSKAQAEELEKAERSVKAAKQAELLRKGPKVAIACRFGAARSGQCVGLAAVRWRHWYASSCGPMLRPSMSRVSRS
jgi:hypothetical protein